MTDWSALTLYVEANNVIAAVFRKISRESIRNSRVVSTSGKQKSLKWSGLRFNFASLTMFVLTRKSGKGWEALRVMWFITKFMQNLCLPFCLLLQMLRWLPLTLLYFLLVIPVIPTRRNDDINSLHAKEIGMYSNVKDTHSFSGPSLFSSVGAMPLQEEPYKDKVGIG